MVMSKPIKEYALKPCPWCGETPRVLERSALDGRRELTFPYYVQCLYIGCEIHPQTGYWKYQNEAVYSWNSRCPEQDMSE